MAAGDLRRPDRRQRAAIEAAVAEAESRTGLELCVYLGALDDASPRDHAEAMFTGAGLHERPAVMIVVAPRQRRVEIVVGPAALHRISDDDAEAAVAGMVPYLRRRDLVGGLSSGLRRLADAAGPGERPDGGEHLPDLIEE